MEICNSFKSKSTGRQYNIRTRITCRSRNLVYLVSCTCKRCGLQYVGETEKALHIRMNGHRLDIRTKKTEKPVAAHFCQSDHSLEDLEVRGIEKKIHDEDTQWRREREFLDFYFENPGTRRTKFRWLRTESPTFFVHVTVFFWLFFCRCT